MYLSISAFLPVYHLYHWALFYHGAHQNPTGTDTYTSAERDSVSDSESDSDRQTDTQARDIYSDRHCGKDIYIYK